MGMGGCEVQFNSSKPSARRHTSVQSVKSGGCIKPRIIHTYSPKVYKIRPEEFLDLVQKLTGRPTTEESTSRTYQFFGNDSNSESSHSQENDSRSAQSVDYDRDEIVKPSVEALGSPVSKQLLASLATPRLVTFNFLPMLSSTPSALNQPRRDQGFPFSSTAY